MKIPTKNMPLNTKKTYLDSYFGGHDQLCFYCDRAKRILKKELKHHWSCYKR